MLAKTLEEYWQKKEIEYEQKCKRCGVCCGSFEHDPCQHLKRHSHDSFYCEIYEDRLGLRKSVSNREFLCVPIRQILHKTWNGAYQCAYKK